MWQTTPLHLSAMHNQQDMAGLLLQHEADVDAVDHKVSCKQQSCRFSVCTTLRRPRL